MSLAATLPPLQTSSSLPSQLAPLPCSPSSECRLRRIQSRETCADHRTDLLPLPLQESARLLADLEASGVGIHQKTENGTVEPAGANSPAIASVPAALADAESAADLHPSFLFSRTSTATESSPPPQSTYPFPPPGLSKPSSSPPDMILPEHESSSCTPRELELKSDSLFTSPMASLSPSESDGSVWSAFRMESFLGSYCHTSTSKSLTPSLSFHIPSEEASESKFDHSPASVTPRPTPPALSSAHWSRLKNSSANETIASLNTTHIPTLHSPSSPQLPSSSLVSPTPRHLPVPHINPLMAQRQRQQAFMSRWNCVRQRNRHTPAMPSFFNPIREEAPGCSWNFLRDPACGGDVNERLSARRGRDSVFEKPLVKLPLTRCRSSCDRIRRDQQSLLGWGIHAWIAPSKHCRYCIADELLKGFLMFRSYEAQRIEQEMRRREEQQEESILFMNAGEAAEDDCIESDAVLLSFPYRTPSTPHDQQDQIQSIPTEPWINYQDLDSSSHTHLHTHTSCVSQSPDPRDVSTWSAELEKRLLASPMIRDIDDFDLEDDDLEGFDDEDLEYYDSDEEEEEEEYSSSGSSSPTSDACECGVESGCRCPRIVIGGEAEGDTADTKPAPVDVISEVANEDSKKVKPNSGKKNTTTICGKVLMSFWEEEDDLDGVDCVRVDVEQVDGCVEVDELSMSMSVVDADKWIMNDMRVVEVQCQA